MEFGIPIPLRIQFKAMQELPVLIVTVIGPTFPGVDKKIVDQAIKIIDMSDKLGGLPVAIYDYKAHLENPSEIACWFQLMFQSHEDLEVAFECIREELGWIS